MDGEADDVVEQETTELNLVPKKNSTSVIWKYFGYEATDTDQNKVICKLCGRDNLQTTDGNTSGLRHHLKKSHEKAYADTLTVEGPPRKTVSAKVPLDQPTVAQAFEKAEKAKPYDKNSKRWKEVTDAVAYHLAKDLRPIKSVENDGFVHLLKTLDPKYKLPNRKHFSKKVIPKMYIDCREKTYQKVIQNIRFFSTTSDLIMV